MKIKVKVTWKGMNILKQLYCSACKRTAWHTNGRCNLCQKEFEDAKPRPVAVRLNLRWSIYTALIFAFFFIVLMVAIGLAWETAEQQHSVYAGLAAFETPEEYAEFKILLAQPDVDIIAYREYSQSYPVLVSYDVTMLSSVEFPYSEAISTYGGGASAWRIGAAVTVLVALFIALIYGVLKTTRKIV